MHNVVTIILLTVTTSLSVIYPGNYTILHTYAQFGPGYDNEGVSGQLVESDPITVCGIESGNYTDKIVLSMRFGEDNTCPYDLQVLSLQHFGAKAVIIMDNIDRDTVLWLTPSNRTLANKITIPSIYISKSNGEFLHDYYDTNPEVFVNISSIGEYVVHEDDPVHFWLYIYQIFLIVAFGISMCYYSDANIVKRLLRKYNSINYHIEPLIYTEEYFKHIFNPKEDVSLQLVNQIGKRKIDPEDLQFVQENRDCCSICLDKFHHGDIVRILPCSHVFHMVCIDPWLQMHDFTCPVCKMKCIEDDKSIHTVELTNEVKKQKCVHNFWKYFIIFNCIAFIFFL